jgi:hypothetical protein
VVANAPASAHSVHTLHAIERGLVILGSVAPVSADALEPPSPPAAAPVGLVDQVPLAISDVELCSPLDLDGEHLSPEVLLHIAYEVVSQFDRAEVFCLLSSNELDLRDFLEDQIESLQLVVEEHDTAAPFMAQDALALDPSPLQLGASSVGLCSGTRTQPLSTFPEWDGREMVDCGGSVVIPTLPRRRPGPPCDVVGSSFCSCGVPPPCPPLVVAPYGRCPCNVHPMPQS